MLGFAWQVFELGPDGGENESDGECLAETDDQPYECGSKSVSGFFCMLSIRCTIQCPDLSFKGEVPNDV